MGEDFRGGTSNWSEEGVFFPLKRIKGVLVQDAHQILEKGF
jgi:hypothetical protein